MVIKTSTTKTVKIAIAREANKAKQQAAVITQEIVNRVIVFYQDFLEAHVNLLEKTKTVQAQRQKD